MKELLMRVREFLFGRRDYRNPEVEQLLATRHVSSADRKQATAEVRQAMKQQAGSLWAFEERIRNPFSEPEDRR